MGFREKGLLAVAGGFAINPDPDSELHPSSTSRASLVYLSLSGRSAHRIFYVIIWDYFFLFFSGALAGFGNGRRFDC